jgi:hypothetical protein
VVLVLFNAGDQLPVMPLLEVKGNAAILLFIQTGATWVNAGIAAGITVTFSVAVLAHCPAAGVKVNVVVPVAAVLIAAGDHVPRMEGTLVEESVSEGAVVPWQISGIVLNDGVTGFGAVSVTVAVGMVKGITQP